MNTLFIPVIIFGIVILLSIPIYIPVFISKIKLLLLAYDIIKQNDPEDKKITKYVPDKMNLAKKLLQLGFINEVDQCDQEGTPYMFYFQDLQSTKIFIQLGMDPNTTNPSGKNTLYYPFIVEESYPRVKYLIEQGIDIHHVDQVYNINILFIYLSNYKIVKLLVENGINVNQIDNKQQNVLYYIKHKTTIFEYLIENGTNIHQINDKNENLLFSENCIGNYDFMSILIKNGIDMYHTPDLLGRQTILHRILDYEISNPYRFGNSINTIKMLFNNGYDPNFNEHLQTESILWKIKSLDERYTKMIIENGLNNVHTLNQDGQNLLFVKDYTKEIQTLLLDKNINIHCVDNYDTNLFDQHSQNPYMCIQLLTHFNKHGQFCKNPKCWCEDKYKILDIKKNFFSSKDKRHFNIQFCKWTVKRFYRKKKIMKLQNIVIQTMCHPEIGFVANKLIDELYV